MLIQEIANAYDEVNVDEKVRGKRLTGLRRALQTAYLLLNGGKLANTVQQRFCWRLVLMDVLVNHHLRLLLRQNWTVLNSENLNSWMGWEKLYSLYWNSDKTRQRLQVSDRCLQKPASRALQSAMPPDLKGSPGTQPMNSYFQETALIWWTSTKP